MGETNEFTKHKNLFKKLVKTNINTEEWISIQNIHILFPKMIKPLFLIETH